MECNRGDDAGFTIIEVLVAATVVVLVSLATLLMLDTATSTTAAGKQRDVANALAQEMMERATAGRYVGPTPAQIASSTNLQGTNDMVDIAASGTGPADRLQALMSSSDSVVGAVSPTTPSPTTSGAPAPAQSWTVKRRGTTYTVTYLACTTSDVVNKVRIDGPADCSNFGGTGCTASTLLQCTYTPPPTPVAPTCTIGVVNNPTSVPNLTVQIALPNNRALQLCLSSLTDQLLGTALAKSLCATVGASNLVNSVTTGLLNTTGGLLGSGLSLSLCPASQVDSGLLAPKGTVASTTRVSVNVSWTDSGRRVQRSVSQTQLVRRAAA